MLSFDKFDSPSTHVEFHSLNHSVAVILRNPASRDLYNLLNEQFPKIFLSHQDNCVFIPSNDIKKTIREIYMMLRKPINQEYGIFLMETKPNPIFFVIEHDFLTNKGYALPPLNAPFEFVGNGTDTDITLTLLPNSIEIKCVDDLRPYVDMLGIEDDKMTQGYIANHTQIDEIIYHLYRLLVAENPPRKYKLFKNTKPNFPATFRDAHRAELFFAELFKQLGESAPDKQSDNP